VDVFKCLVVFDKLCFKMYGDLVVRVRWIYMNWYGWYIFPRHGHCGGGLFVKVHVQY